MAFRTLISILCLFVFKALYSQYEINHGIWLDEYTIQEHKDVYLANVIYGKTYYRTWDNDSNRFISALPFMLSFPPFASKSVEVKTVELAHMEHYHLYHWEKFSEKRIDSLFNLCKKKSQTTLVYDEEGRLISSDYKNSGHKPYIDKRYYLLHYTRLNDTLFIESKINSKQGVIFKRKGETAITYKLNAQNEVVSSTSRHKGKYDKNVLQKEYYTYDKKGRITSLSVKDQNDSLLSQTITNYTDVAFDLDSAQEHFFALKIPAIQRWIRTDHAEDELRMVSYNKYEPNRRGEVEYIYLVNKEHERLMMLRPYPTYYTEIHDSNAVIRAVVGISMHQDLNDTIPYDPNFKPKIIGFRHDHMGSEPEYTRIPGLVNADRVELYKRSEIALNDGWTLILYQRGSSSPSRFAPGHKPSCRLDVIYDEYVILDEKGRVRYIGSYKGLSKVVVE